MIRRLGVIVMNILVEVDIYAYVNFINVNGFRMLNGLGGFVDFLRNVKLFIMYVFFVRLIKVDFIGIFIIVFMVFYVD